MNLHPFGEEVTKDEFDEFLKKFPHAKRDGWSNANLWINPLPFWKKEWIAVEVFGRKTRYYIDESNDRFRC